MIHYITNTLVPVCVHSDLLGVSVCHLLATLTARLTQKGLHLGRRCQIMNELHRSVHPLQSILADNAFWEHPTCWNRFNVNQISSLKDTLSLWKYLFSLLVYTCLVMQFIFISTLYNISFVVCDWILLGVGFHWLHGFKLNLIAAHSRAGYQSNCIYVVVSVS